MGEPGRRWEKPALRNKWPSSQPPLQREIAHTWSEVSMTTPAGYLISSTVGGARKVGPLNCILALLRTEGRKKAQMRWMCKEATSGGLNSRGEEEGRYTETAFFTLDRAVVSIRV